MTVHLNLAESAGGSPGRAVADAGDFDEQAAGFAGRNRAAAWRRVRLRALASRGLWPRYTRVQGRSVQNAQFPRCQMSSTASGASPLPKVRPRRAATTPRTARAVLAKGATIQSVAQPQTHTTSMNWHRQNGPNIDQERSLPSQPKARELAADTGAINRRRFHSRSELLPKS